MIYTTKDLLKRALDLCDCANTDFLSNEEKERYLNESYAELYQKAIDRGDDRCHIGYGNCLGVMPGYNDDEVIRTKSKGNGSRNG